MPKTASPPTSSHLVDRAGSPWSEPVEWQRGYLLIDAPIDDVGEIEAFRNREPLTVTVRRVGDHLGVVAEWSVAGPGYYEVTVMSHGQLVGRQRHRVAPSKFSEAAFGTMLEELETNLPVTVAVALESAGAHLDVAHLSAGQHTLATEVARLRRAVWGEGSVGLVAVLTALSKSPHAMLTNVGHWVRRHQARRIDPNRLVDALWRADNIEGHLPRVLVDHRVAHKVDVYENQLLRSFHDAVWSRLVRLQAVLGEAPADSPLRGDLNTMATDLLKARRTASFLDDVRPLREAPNRVTMVLLRRGEYRAAFEGYQAFRRRPSVTLREPRLREPLTNLPYLYQLWGALHAISGTLTSATLMGFEVRRHELVRPTGDGLTLDPMPRGKPVLVMTRPDGWKLRLVHEKTYGKGRSLRSVSFNQVPDVALELESPGGEVSVLLLDPKYKLDSYNPDEPSDGRPKKEDVDKMHAYRDAIRDAGGKHVVAYAATLYPGQTVPYGEGLAALRAIPGSEPRLDAVIGDLVAAWMRREIGV